MRVVAIVQARMQSTRLPGKVLADINGRPMLARVVERLSLCRRCDEIVIATSDLPADDPLAAAARQLGVGLFRGSEIDVLDRFHQAARRHQADVIVRITADCPLVDPRLADEAIANVADDGAACSAVVPLGPRAYPRGFDCEACTADALDQAWREARLPHERAHVTPFLYERPERFRFAPLEADADYRHFRLTVDMPCDLSLVRALHKRLACCGPAFSWRDCVAILTANPILSETNRGISQKPLLAG